MGNQIVEEPFNKVDPFITSFVHGLNRGRARRTPS
jgi:hypothetical protein